MNLIESYKLCYIILHLSCFISSAGIDFFPPSVSSFFLAQVDINDATAQQQRDTQPGQDEAVTKASRAQLLGVGEDFRDVERVDESSRKSGQT